MKPSSKAILAAAAFCLAACTPGPEDNPEPIADAGENPAQGTGAGDGTSEGTSENPTGSTNNGLASRLRLPNMENLPSDKELASKQNTNKGSGGVIARPPSE